MNRIPRPQLVIPLIVILVVAAGTAYFVTRPTAAASRYRTAAATLGTVTQTIALAGNLTPVGETDLDFGAAGKVASVNVVPGQSIAAGTVVATLDPTTLHDAFVQSQATLQAAQAKLSLDQSGPTAQSLAQAQAQVNTAAVQLQASRIGLVDTRLVNQQAQAQAQASVAAAASTVAADQAALTADQIAQPLSIQKVTTDQQTLARDQGALTTAQYGLAAERGKAQQSLDQAQAQVNSEQVGLTNAQTALSALTAGTTSQQLQIDQTQVQIDQVNLDGATRNVNSAALIAPVAGLVGQVNLVAGQSVGSSGSSSSGGASGGSGTTSTAAPSTSTHAVVVITPGVFEVTGTVSDSQINQIAVGQRARVTAAGFTEADAGRVTQVSPEATITSGVATFAVTVTLDGSNPSLHAGASASISVVVNQVAEVLTVPTSAVQTSGGGSTVQVLVDGKPQARAVQVGATDPLRTQITGGLSRGEIVVIATISGTVPAANPRAGGGLLGGGGAGGGGAGGGGAGRGAGG